MLTVKAATNTTARQNKAAARRNEQNWRMSLDHTLLRGVFDVVAVVVGDGCGVGVCIGDGAAVLFLCAAGDCFVAAYFGLCFLLFVALVFFLAFLEGGCHRLARVCRRRRSEKKAALLNQYGRSWAIPD
jgi:hypothetical protein